MINKKKRDKILPPPLRAGGKAEATCIYIICKSDDSVND